MNNPDAESLRVRLAEKLGYTKGLKVFNRHEHFWVSPATGLLGSLPDLASLVAEAERGLNQGQREHYSIALAKSALISQPIKRDIYGGDYWIHVTPLEAFEIITAAPEARAQALLKVLP